MTKKFTSPIFGETRDCSDDERAQVAKLVADVPVTVFCELGKKFNELGLCISIITKAEIQ
ncbi:MAG: hypothetical protein WCD45_04045 [Gallionella sp.]